MAFTNARSGDEVVSGHEGVRRNFGMGNSFIFSL